MHLDSLSQHSGLYSLLVCALINDLYRKQKAGHHTEKYMMTCFCCRETQGFRVYPPAKARLPAPPELLGPGRFRHQAERLKHLARRIMNLHTASKYRTGILRLLAAVISCYGLYAFFHNGMPDYLLLRSSFVFFPPDQTASQFLMDYAAIMGLYLTIVHYGGIFLRTRVTSLNYEFTADTPVQTVIHGPAFGCWPIR